MVKKRNQVAELLLMLIQELIRAVYCYFGGVVEFRGGMTDAIFSIDRIFSSASCCTARMARFDSRLR